MSRTEEEYNFLNTLYLDIKHKYETLTHSHELLKEDFDVLNDEYIKLSQFVKEVALSDNDEDDKDDNLNNSNILNS
jgi:hypothetical protein